MGGFVAVAPGTLVGLWATSYGCKASSKDPKLLRLQRFTYFGLNPFLSLSDHGHVIM